MALKVHELFVCIEKCTERLLYIAKSHVWGSFHVLRMVLLDPSGMLPAEPGRRRQRALAVVAGAARMRVPRAYSRACTCVPRVLLFLRSAQLTLPWNTARCAVSAHAWSAHGLWTDNLRIH